MTGPEAVVVAFLARNFEQQGFFENQSRFYPQTVVGDSSHATNETRARWEFTGHLTSWLTIAGGLDAQVDSHRSIERSWSLNLDDRSTLRPAFSLRRFSATLHKGKVTAELGRQIIQWGKADLLNPTDRFAPRDYGRDALSGDPLGVIAARLTVESGPNTFDLVWQPWFTPSRPPPLDQRWSPLPAMGPESSAEDLGSRYPGGGQYGARWNHVGAGYEFSFSFFDGFDNLPLFGTVAQDFQRSYPAMRLYGFDAAVPLPWFTCKGEAAYITSPVQQEGEYALYVIQLERQVKDWSFEAGYAGEDAARTPSPLRFSPDLGFTRAFLGRAGLDLNVNSRVSLDTAVRLHGSMARGEYSRALGPHLRVTGGVTWIHGDMTDFLGEYHRNSYVSLGMRYTF